MTTETQTKVELPPADHTHVFGYGDTFQAEYVWNAQSMVAYGDARAAEAREQAQADTARLDWAEKNMRRVGMIQLPGTTYAQDTNCWAIAAATGTLREAIDAARDAHDPDNTHCTGGVDDQLGDTK